MPVLFLCLSLLFNMVAPCLASAHPAIPPVPRLSSQAFVLMDQDTGLVLLSRRAHERREPASLTKILTALVALEEASIEEPLTVSTRAAGVGGAAAGLRAGQKLELWVGLYGLLFLSGNDAARAIAENIGGSESGFSALMNERARRIGAVDTHFVNPHGLSAGGHFSSAYDLALITREALKNETLARIVGRTSRTLPWGGGTRSVANINKFMYRYPGATGVKTGYTAPAGYCLAASATRGRRRLLAILLGAPASEARWQDATRIMDYGFNNYDQLKKARNEGSPADGGGSTYRVREGDTIWSLARRAGTSVDAVLALNPGLDPDHIYAGEEIYLPAAAGN